MSDRIYLVTGATSGIGQAVAGALGRQGERVVIVARDEVRGRAAAAAIPGAELLLADLASLASVRALAEAWRARYARLDGLIHSAAVFKNSRHVTGDGLEYMFAVNHLAPFLLTHLLREPLRAAGAARVLTLTAPATNHLNFDDLQGERGFNALNAFGATKMANLLFTFELARRLEGSGVVAHAIHPGLVRTRLMREAPVFIRAFSWLMSAAPERAAEPIARVATAPEYAAQTGRFYLRGREIKADAYAYDRAIQVQLWQVSARVTGTDA